MLDALERFVKGELERDEVLQAADLPLRKLAAAEALARHGRATPELVSAIAFSSRASCRTARCSTGSRSSSAHRRCRARDAAARRSRRAPCARVSTCRDRRSASRRAAAGWSTGCSPRAT
jgi:hypothetical protein